MKLFGGIGKLALALSLLLAAGLIGTPATAQEGTPSGKIPGPNRHRTDSTIEQSIVA